MINKAIGDRTLKKTEENHSRWAGAAGGNWRSGGVRMEEEGQPSLQATSALVAQMMTVKATLLAVVSDCRPPPRLGHCAATPCR